MTLCKYAFNLVVVVVDDVVPSALKKSGRSLRLLQLWRSRTAQEVPVCGPQGRHDVCAPHVLHFGVEASQQFVPGAHEGRAAQDHVLRSVGFLPAYRAEGRAALRVVALLALPGGRLPDPVSPLGRGGPVAGSQLVDVDRGLPVSSGTQVSRPCSVRIRGREFQKRAIPLPCNLTNSNEATALELSLLKETMQ